MAASVAAAQEAPTVARPPVPRVGTFALDASYPRNGNNPSVAFNFGVVSQQLDMPQEVVYFLFDMDSDVFAEARSKGLEVWTFMGACDRLKDRPAYGYQRVGGRIEPLAAVSGMGGYIGAAGDGTIFVPVFRNLRLYEPRTGRIGYEWLERVITEGGLCLDVGLRGKMFGSRQLFEVDLTKYARFTYE